eukprot:gene12445-biopygen464
MSRNPRKVGDGDPAASETGMDDMHRLEAHPSQRGPASLFVIPSCTTRCWGTRAAVVHLRRGPRRRSPPSPASLLPQPSPALKAGAERGGIAGSAAAATASYAVRMCAAVPEREITFTFALELKGPECVRMCQSRM